MIDGLYIPGSSSVLKDAEYLPTAISRSCCSHKMHCCIIQGACGGVKGKWVIWVDHSEWPSSFSLLRVSALHYSAGDRVSGGFRTVASARVLRQPTSCGSEYFYNQRPQVRNLIGTEHSLIEVSVGLRRKQAKSNSVDRFRNTEVFSDRPGFWIMKADYFQYMEIESQRYS